ncbi:MAG: hypothetical protein AAFY28_03805 [Actinomycetota bacterium]
MSVRTITRSTIAATLSAAALIGVADAAEARETREPQPFSAERTSTPPATFEFAGPTMMEFDPNIGADVIGALDTDSPPPPPPGPSAGGLYIADTNGHGGNGGSPWQAADDYKAGPGCSVACITSGVAYQHGPDARVRVTTDTDAKIWIIVWDDQGYHRVEESFGYSSQEFEVIFDDVDLDSTYSAMAVAEDGEGYTDHANGEFTTGQRNVTVEFGDANVSVTPANATTFHSRAFVDNDPTSVGELPATDTLYDIQQHLDLAVHASFDRPAITNAPCEVYSLSLELSHYLAGNCYVRAAVYGDDIDLDGRPANAGAGAHVIETTLQHPGGQALPPGYGQELQYSVPVELTVWYG